MFPEPGCAPWTRLRSARTVADQRLGELIGDVHVVSQRSHWAPRTHAELRLGLGVQVGRQRIRRAGLSGISHRREPGLRPLPAPAQDLAYRQFAADVPDELWATEHPTTGGKGLCCAVLDAYSRVVVGWSIADHMRAELVVSALPNAIGQQPVGTVVAMPRHSPAGRRDRQAPCTTLLRRSPAPDRSPGGHAQQRGRGGQATDQREDHFGLGPLPGQPARL